MHEPTEFQVSKLTSWLEVHVPGLIPPFNGQGSPAVTPTLRTGSTTQLDGYWYFVALRFGELLPTAHDMAREFAVISGLWGTAVPLPQPIAYCDDDEVVGAPFYAMGWVEGRSLFTAQDAEEHLTVWGSGTNGDLVHRYPGRPPCAQAGGGGLGRLLVSADLTSVASSTAGTVPGTPPRIGIWWMWIGFTTSWSNDFRISQRSASCMATTDCTTAE